MVEHWLPKPRVAGSSPVYRSFIPCLMNNGFVRVAAAVPAVEVADCMRNVEQIHGLCIEACARGAEVVCFPELSVTGYTCADLFHSQVLLEEAELGLISLLNSSRSMNLIIIVGMPVAYGGALMNCAVVLQKGRLLGIVPKTFLPNYKEFYEKRWFTSALDVAEGTVLICGQQVRLSARQLFRTPNFTFGIELCEDLWAPVPPSCTLAMQGADVVFNLSADNDIVGKRPYLDSLVKQQSARTIGAYVLCGCGFGESTQDLVFGGKTIICENGSLLAQEPRHTMDEILTLADVDMERLRTERRQNTTFASNARLVKDLPLSVTDTANVQTPPQTLMRRFDPRPFVPTGKDLDERCEEIFAIQTEGLAKRVRHTNAETLVVGISGGLDSTLALLVCARTMDRLGKSRRAIVGITMPGFGTTDRTYTNAVTLMRRLGVTIREISIADACTQHFHDIGHDMARHDVTYENGQARERTQILMDAANQMNGLVVGTGDLSELALGWATYNGDHMSMYGVNASVPKTLVAHLVAWVANTQSDEDTRATLLDIVDTPISPELIPADADGQIAQKTEDLVGPYELHDFFLYYTLRFGFRPTKIFAMARSAFEGKHAPQTIRHWLTVFFRRFFAQQFKRSCLPDGPKVGSCSLSPRGDWRMPSDASARAWIAECEGLLGR